MVRSILIAGFGGFLGTVFRFVLSKYIQENSASLFPWSTLMVNLAGCLLIGLIYGISEKGDLLSSEVRLFFTVGICGGFTTFSSFSNDAFLLLKEKELLYFTLYATLSFFLCILAVYLGRIIAKVI